MGLINYVQSHLFLFYIILFINCLFEGETLLLFSGILIKMHKIFFLETFFIAFFSAVFGDIFWFWFIRRFIKYRILKNYKRRKNIRKILRIFYRNQKFFLFFHRFFYGIRSLSLLSISLSKVKYKKFIMYNSVSSFVWVLLFISLGYIFSNSIIYLFTHYFKYSLLLVISFLIFSYLLEKKLKSKISE